MAILVGLIFGVAAAVPIGPIGILAITQSVRHGFRRGYSVALASSALEAAYSLIAVEAAAFVNQLILKYSHIMKFIGAAVLVGVGVGIIRQSRTFDPLALVGDRNKKEIHPVLKAVALYVSSPTIPAYWLMAAGLVVAHGAVVRGHPSAFFFAVACGIGSALWAFILLRFILRTPRRLKAKTFRTIFVSLGILLLALGALNILSVWVKMPGALKTG